MQAYQNVTPPFSLSSGDVGFSFNNEAFPAANTAGSQFALPSFTGISDGGTAVRWQTIFGTTPSKRAQHRPARRHGGRRRRISADRRHHQRTGEARSVAAVQAKFLRIKLSPQRAAPA